MTFLRCNSSLFVWSALTKPILILIMHFRTKQQTTNLRSSYPWNLLRRCTEKGKSTARWQWRTRPPARQNISFYTRLVSSSVWPVGLMVCSIFYHLQERKYVQLRYNWTMSVQNIAIYKQKPFIFSFKDVNFFL